VDVEPVVIVSQRCDRDPVSTEHVVVFLRHRGHANHTDQAASSAINVTPIDIDELNTPGEGS
jgi:hypothetical protein